MEWKHANSSAPSCVLKPPDTLTFTFRILMANSLALSNQLDNARDGDCIHIIQSKTGQELRIPLTTSVGNALWDYITNQRPRSGKKEILVSDRRPFDHLPDLWHHIKKVFNEADVRREGGRTGVRIFRHHLATTLLANETEAPVISSILGHTDPASLNPYLDADVEHLRECALSIERFPVAEEAFMV